MKPRGMIQFNEEAVPPTRKEANKSIKSTKHEQHQTLDSQNTSVNIMRRTSSFISTKSNFSTQTHTQHLTNTIQFDGQMELDRVKEVLCSVGSFMFYEIEVVSDKRILMVKNVDSVWMKLCGYCVKGRGNKDSVISIEFKTDALNNRKVMTIKLVEGSFSSFESFEKEVQQKLTHLEPKGGLCTLSSNISPQVSVRRGSIDMIQTSHIEDSPFSMESKGYVTIKNILEKSYGSSITKLKESIKSLRPRIMNKTTNQNQLINEMLRTINKVYEETYSNLGTYNFDVVYYSIEKYVCELCLPLMQEIYQQRLEEEEQIFQSKKEKILSKWENSDIIKYLEIKPQFQLIPEGASPSYTPYSLAINKLSSLGCNLSLREKMRVVQEFYSTLKVCCYQFHKGKLQIATMDDILPVIIFTVLKSDVKNFYCELKMVDDYARACGRFEGDQRILTNIYVGLEYVSKQWSLD